MVHYPYASWSHAAGCPQAIWEQYVLILHSTLPLTLQLGHKSCQASKKFVYLILHVCVYIFHAPCCMTLSCSTALYGSVFVNCEMLVWTTCWCKTVMPVWRWQQSQFFHCGHVSDRGGHHRPFSEHFTLAMNAEMAWSFGRVSKCCKNWYTNAIFSYLYMETKLQDTKLYQGLGTMRLRLVVSENWLFIDEAS